MPCFALTDLFFGFILISCYIAIIYIVIKQSIRLVSFTDEVINLKEQTVKRQSLVRITYYAIIAIVYLISTFLQAKLDLYYATEYHYFDMAQYRFFLKWAINLLPFFFIILRAVCTLPKHRISSKGIVGDKFAFKWHEITRIETEHHAIIIHYNYKILFFTFNLQYRISSRDEAAIEVIYDYSSIIS